MNEDNPNLKTWILDCAGDEEIEAVVLGAVDYYSKTVPKVYPENKVLTWDEASKYIDYTFDDGYGAVECHAIYAWTKNKVIFVSCYDGSTRPCVIPRHPIDCEPQMPGGG